MFKGGSSGNSLIKNEDDFDEKLFNAREEFFNRTDRRNLSNHIKQLVGKQHEIHNENLEKKRNILKQLLDSEQLQYEQEFIENFKMKSQLEKIKHQESIETFLMEKEKDRKEFNKLKKMQALINNSDEIRLSLRKDLLHESKSVQLQQIKEKQKQKLNERKQEELWLKVRQKIEEEERKREQYENDLKQMMLKEEQKDFLRKREEYEERKRLEKQSLLEERLRDEEENRAELKRLENEQNLQKEKKKKQAELLQAQFLESLNFKKERQDEEKDFERQFNEVLKQQIEYEKNLTNTKMTDLKLSTLRYLEYCNEIKIERELQQKEEEKALEEYRKKTELKQMQMKNAIKEKKAQEAKKAYEELLKQIQQNKERQLNEYQTQFNNDKLNREIHEKNLQFEHKQEIIKKQENMLKYRKELLEQIDEMKKLNLERQRLYQEDIKRAADEDEYLHKLADHFIKEGIHKYLPTHPNWSIICRSYNNN